MDAHVNGNKVSPATRRHHVTLIRQKVKCGSGAGRRITAFAQVVQPTNYRKVRLARQQGNMFARPDRRSAIVLA